MNSYSSSRHYREAPSTCLRCSQYCILKLPFQLSLSLSLSLSRSSSFMFCAFLSLALSEDTLFQLMSDALQKSQNPVLIENVQSIMQSISVHKQQFGNNVMFTKKYVLSLSFLSLPPLSLTWMTAIWTTLVTRRYWTASISMRRENEERNNQDRDSVVG